MNSASNTDMISQAGSWLRNATRRNPEGLLLLAAGCALLMRSGRGSNALSDGFREVSREVTRNLPDISDATSGLRRGLSQTADQAADYASDLKNRASDVAGSYAESVSEFAGEAGRAVSENSARLTRQAQDTLQSTMDRVLRDQPLAVAVFGLAAGAAVAAAFPATDVENRVLGGTHEALSNAADQAGQAVMGAASKAGERLKSAAEERGLTSNGLRDLVGEVAETFTDSVAGKTEAKRPGNDSSASAGSTRGNGNSTSSSVTSNSNAMPRTSGNNPGGIR
jgi:hypothetical protein